MKKVDGFSLIEVMILLLICSMLILASYPIFTKKRINEAMNTNVVTCIEIQGAASLTTPECNAAISGGLTNNSNYFDTLTIYVDSANSTTSNNGLKILKEICDRGGNRACNKIIDRCANSISKCEVAGNTYDLEYYLRLLPSDSNLSKSYIKSILTPYYNVGMTNIKTEVDKWCCYNGINLACDASGVDYCSLKFSSDMQWIGGNAIALDSAGNIYKIGSYNSGSPVSMQTIVQKFDRSGNIVWQRNIDGTGSDFGTGITLDNAGNIYITGHEQADARGQRDVYIMRLNPLGETVWMSRFGDPGYNDSRKIVLDSSGNTYIVGECEDAWTYKDDIYVAKYNSAGTRVWINRIGGTGDDTGYGIALDSAGNIYITGSETADTYGGSDVFVVKLTTAGVISWQKKFGGAADDVGYGIVIDAANNIYVTGYESSDSYGGSDVFVAKLTTAGGISWVKQIGGADDDIGHGITLDSAGNIYVTGYEVSDTFAGGKNLFVVELDAGGNTMWQKKIGVSGSSSFGLGIAIDNAGMIYTLGGTGNSVSGRVDSAFILKFKKGAGNMNLSTEEMTKSFSDINTTLFKPQAQSAFFTYGSINPALITNVEGFTVTGSFMSMNKILGLP